MLDGDALIYMLHCHIGCAADMPKGWVVPVFNDTDEAHVSGTQDWAQV